MFELRLLRFNKHIVITYIFLFLIMFGITINGLDLRYPSIFLGILFFAFRYQRFYFPNKSLYICLFLALMSIYAFFISYINNNNDYFESFRFLRCFASTIFIGILIGQYDISPKDMLRILKTLFLVHAFAVLLCIIFPHLKEILLPISKYTKEFSPIRSTGLVNGEDAAGYLCVIGLIINLFERILAKKTPINLSFVIFLIATIFTSRFTWVMVFVVLIITYLYLLKTNRISHANSLLIFLIPGAALALIVIVLTTPFAYGFRDYLLETLPFARNIYQMMIGSYLDYSIFSSAVYRNISVSDLSVFDMIFGTGIKSNVRQDSGYIKTIYSIGVIGILLVLTFHISLLRNMKKIIDKNKQYDYVYRILFIIVIVSVFWELKYSFLFSSTFFETIICIFLSVEHSVHNTSELYEQ